METEQGRSKFNEVNIPRKEEVPVSCSTASSHLKSLLGVSTNAVRKPTWGAAQESNTTKLSLLSIQEEESKKQQLEKKAVDVSLVQKSPLSGTWQVPVSNPSNSLREIMQQEKMMDEKRSKQQEHLPTSTGNTWAAKAATFGTTNMASARPPRPFVAAGINTSAAIQKSTIHSGGISSVQATRPSEDSTTNSSKSANIESISGESVDEFSDKGMSPDFCEWCSNQLLKINGNKDLTLVKFCTSIESASEIRETLAAYLGSTPQVSQFATEFLRRKEDPSMMLNNDFKRAERKKRR